MSEASPGRRAVPEASGGAAGRAPRRPERDGPQRKQDQRKQDQRKQDGQPAPSAARPLYVTGLVAALWCIGIGLAVLTTVTLIGWIAAPKTALGDGLSGVFRTAVNFWLVSHHAGFSYGQGRVGLLPLGVLVLPGALLYRGGGWMIRAAGLPHRPRKAVVHVAVALAAPYAGLAGLLALAAASPQVRPSAWQALLGGFLVAVIAGGLGAARAVVAAQVAAQARGERVRSGLGALLRLLPDRPRSLVIGVAGSLAVLLASGALLVGASLAVNMPDADHLYDLLAPGVVGGVLLLLVELAFLPNAVIWGMAYAVGPGFSVGAGTSVSPTGVFLDAVPAFPPLAALPDPGPAPAISLLALAAPFVAGAVGGVLTIRSLPAPVSEGAPMWGFVSGALTGAVVALLSALSGGPLGGGRMATVGPSAWQVGLLAALEVGISAAIAAWAANTMILRRPVRAASKPGRRPRKRQKERAKESTKGRAGARRAPAPLPLSAPVPDDYQSEPRPAPRAPYAPDPLEFEEADPVLTPRRPARRKADPLPDLAEERPERKPAPPPSDGTVVVEGHLMDDPADLDDPAGPPGPVDEPRPGEPSVPLPREDPGRTENRGGAIYVLREEREEFERDD
ncbi:cell division protein PerM [Actinomadura sp. 3N407]|uniref:cell division protein PerM n=1 Tax=Actinomadura sp. 3N407 TaxID=3457423 RepID=UPI003FCC9D39